MRLYVPFPEGWEQRTVEDGVLVQAPEAVYGVLVMSVGPAQPDVETWLARAFMYRVRPDDPPPSDLQSGRLTTAAGWTAVILEGRLGPQGRIVAYLEFMDFSSTVIGMCRTPEAVPQWRNEVLELIRQAQPNLHDSTINVCLARQLGVPPTVLENRTSTPIIGWTRRMCGGDLVLTHATDAARGVIQIAQHVGPIRSVSALFAEFFRPDPDTKSELPTVATTDEGEYLAIARASKAASQQTLAVIYGDTSYTRITSTVTAREHFDSTYATASELAYSTTLGLGTWRWRRYYYEPPSGWNGIARPHGALWVSLHCPRQFQVMRVLDARPASEHAARHGMRMFEMLPEEFYREEPKGPAVYYTADGLEVTVWVYTARLANRAQPTKVIEGTLATDEYIYPIRMECDESLLVDSMQVFERVIASLRPLPHRRAARGQMSGSFAYLAD